MAETLIYELDYPGYSFPAYMKKIPYGRCTEPPHSSMSFITIFEGTKKGKQDEFYFPEEDTTFIVPSQYAHPMFLGDWKRNLEKWEKVAVKIYQGKWCSRFERLWRDVPINEYNLIENQKIKVAYCETKDGQDYYYVSFFNSETIVTFSEFATKEFVYSTGNDSLKWSLITRAGNYWNDGQIWNALIPEKLHTVKDFIEWGTRLRPTSIANARARLDKYQELENLFSKRNRDKNWQDLSEKEKRGWIESTTRKSVDELLFFED